MVDVAPVQIFIPFYGDPGQLDIAVRSVLAQEDGAWSLTIVDDRYPDEAVAAAYADVDPRVTVIRNEVNLGSNRNFEKCLSLADRDLVVFLGCDDELLPHYVSTIRAARAAHPDCALIQPAVEVIDEHGDPGEPLADRVKQRLLRPRAASRLVMSGEPLATSLLRGNWLYFPSLAFDRRRAQACGFRPGLDTIQDLGLIMDMVVGGGSLVVDDTLCFRYRRHQASESSWRAVAGDRFAEDRAFFLGEAVRLEGLGWHRAARVSRRHLISRLHAFTMFPSALRARDRTALRVLARHALGRHNDRRLQVQPGE